MRRAGFTKVALLTDLGAVDLAVPRDRNGEFDPKIVPKHARRLEGFNERIISLLPVAWRWGPPAGSAPSHR